MGTYKLPGKHSLNKPHRLTNIVPDIKGGKGTADALFINDAIPKPQLNQGSSSQALVKIIAFGLNRMDLLQREGHYPVPPQAPKTLGVEFSGVVESLGYGEEKGGFKVGDEVFGLAYGGQSARFLSPSLPLSFFNAISIEIDSGLKMS